MNPATARAAKAQRIVSTPKKQGEERVLESLKAAPRGRHHETLRRNVSHTQCLVCHLKEGFLSPGQSTGRPETPCHI